MVKTFFQWLLLSSSNPDKISLTIKGAAGVVISIVIALAGLAHLQLSSADLTPIVDSTIAIVNSILLIVSSVAAVWGVIRKIYLSFSNKNQVTLLQNNGQL